jgi:hypothetical protein
VQGTLGCAGRRRGDTQLVIGFACIRMSAVIRNRKSVLFTGHDDCAANPARLASLIETRTFRTVGS